MALQSNKKKAGQFKITIWILYCVIFFFICSFENLYSQVIIGTVHDCGNKKPIENANLHIKDTSIGTSSNKFGFFKINYNYNNIENLLIISHVAYKEKIIDLNENQIQDTLNICLESKSINLTETTISANFIDVFGEHDYSILDFNFIDNNVLLLVFDYRKNSKDLIITNSLFDTIFCLSNESLKKAVNIYKDCLEKCHLVCKDTVYQIDYYDSTLTINYPVSINKFNEAVNNCLFECSEYLVFKLSSNNGFNNEFYAVNKEDHSTRIIHSAMQSQKLKQLNNEIDWILSHPYLYTNVNEAILFEKRIMYKPSILSMNKVGDSIYLFDHSNDCIDVYSSNLDYIRSMNIYYHLNKNWNKKIIIDPVQNLAYTTITENNFEILYLINLGDGNINKRIRIPYIFPYKVKVNNGFLYVLFKESSNQPIVKKIYRCKL